MRSHWKKVKKYSSKCCKENKKLREKILFYTNYLIIIQYIHLCLEIKIKYVIFLEGHYCYKISFISLFNMLLTIVAASYF